MRMMEVMHLRPRPPRHHGEGREYRDGVTAVGVKCLPESKNEVRPKDKHVRAEEQGASKGCHDIADEMFEGVGVLGIQSDAGFEGVVLLVEALVEPTVVKHWRGVGTGGWMEGKRLV